jgi:hypothetical protein
MGVVRAVLAWRDVALARRAAVDLERREALRDGHQLDHVDVDVGGERATQCTVSALVGDSASRPA